MLQLYTYFRSSASYRVRVALNIKGLEYEHHSVHLVKDGGEQHKPDYKALNPQALVPTLVDDNFVLTQSMAILEYLEEKYPMPPILPQDIKQRAFVRQIAMVNVADIHPLNNLKVLNHLSNELGVTQAQKKEWYHKWVHQGFEALEKIIARSPYYTGNFCCGDSVTMADICLVPQVYNAHRFEVPMAGYPLISAIEKKCLALDVFKSASPESQPDAPTEPLPLL